MKVVRAMVTIFVSYENKSLRLASIYFELFCILFLYCLLLIGQLRDVSVRRSYFLLQQPRPWSDSHPTYVWLTKRRLIKQNLVMNVKFRFRKILPFKLFIVLIIQTEILECVTIVHFLLYKISSALVALQET